jgi:ribonuclease HI
MAKSKFYAVAAGRTTGIFTDWSTAEKQVKGFAGARFKSFTTRIEAESWLKTPVYAKAAPKAASAVATASVAEKNPDDAIIIYTDGGAINNPGPGGYGIVICDGDDRREMSGGFRLTTNNRMEMTACIVALQNVAGCGRPIVLYSDSSYLVNGISKGWAKKWRVKGWRKSDGTPALNPDLWEELLDLLETEDVIFRWVKGHNGNELNECCDRLAVSMARSEGLPADRGYEQSR